VSPQRKGANEQFRVPWLHLVSFRYSRRLNLSQFNLSRPFAPANTDISFPAKNADRTNSANRLQTGPISWKRTKKELLISFVKSEGYMVGAKGLEPLTR
jgi:hypothetical protein